MNRKKLKKYTNGKKLSQNINGKMRVNWLYPDDSTASIQKQTCSNCAFNCGSYCSNWQITTSKNDTCEDFKNN